MRNRIACALIAAAAIALQLGCNALTDPAVRLANCLEEGIKTSPAGAASIQVNCDLKLSGNYVVVLHPAGEKTDDELRAGGVPAEVIPELRVLRISDNSSIYVISTGANITGTGSARSVLSSRTTYQNNFIRIERLLVAAKTSQPVTVEIGGAAEAREVRDIR